MEPGLLNIFSCMTVPGDTADPVEPENVRPLSGAEQVSISLDAPPEIEYPGLFTVLSLIISLIVASSKAWSDFVH